MFVTVCESKNAGRDTKTISRIKTTSTQGFQGWKTVSNTADARCLAREVLRWSPHHGFTRLCTAITSRGEGEVVTGG